MVFQDKAKQPKTYCIYHQAAQPLQQKVYEAQASIVNAEVQICCIALLHFSGKFSWLLVHQNFLRSLTARYYIYNGKIYMCVCVSTLNMKARSFLQPYKRIICCQSKTKDFILKNVRCPFTCAFHSKLVFYLFLFFFFLIFSL